MTYAPRVDGRQGAALVPALPPGAEPAARRARYLRGRIDRQTASAAAGSGPLTSAHEHS